MSSVSTRWWTKPKVEADQDWTSIRHFWPGDCKFPKASLWPCANRWLTFDWLILSSTGTDDLMIPCRHCVVGVVKLWPHTVRELGTGEKRRVEQENSCKMTSRFELAELCAKRWRSLGSRLRSKDRKVRREGPSLHKLRSGLLIRVLLFQPNFNPGSSSNY